MVSDIGTFGMFLIALATSVFYAAALWVIYVALEPFVRHYWPQTLISWSRALSGRLRDPIVGRDLLVALCVSISWRMLSHGLSLLVPVQQPSGVAPEILTGLRGAIGEMLELIPGGIRGALFYFFILFVFRVILRRQWAAAVAFTAMMVALHILPSGDKMLRFVATVFIFSSVSFVVLRFGLLALTLTHLVDGLLSDLPVTFDATVWYFPSFVLMAGVLFVAALWGFKQAIAGRQLWKQETFG
jgi:hypothetical protein